MTPTPTKPQADAGGMPSSISKSPAFVSILTGDIPGVYIPTDREYPSATQLSESPEDIAAVGLELYVSQDQQGVIVFNPLKISAEEIQVADQQGKLAQIMPEYGELTGEQAEPVQAQGSMEEQLAATGAPSPALPPPMGVMPPSPPAAVSKPLNRERVANMTPGPATTGPKPGAGRLANMLATSAV